MNATKSQIWRGLVNEVGTAIRNHNGYIYIPNIKDGVV